MVRGLSRSNQGHTREIIEKANSQPFAKCHYIENYARKMVFGKKKRPEGRFYNVLFVPYATALYPEQCSVHVPDKKFLPEYLQFRPWR